MINIRSIKPGDRPVLLQIIKQTGMFSPAEVDVAMELIDVCLNQKEQKDYTIHVATDETDSIVGYVCYGPTPATIGTFDLYWIVVDVVCQNQGIGKQLLQFVESEVSRRVGRLIMIAQLLSKGFPPAIIQIEDRYKYYMALGKADTGDFRNIVQMVCDSMIKGYELLK